MLFLANSTNIYTETLSRNSNNFDFLRLLAATLVIIAHSSVLLFNQNLSFDPFDTIFGIKMGRFGVLLFFAISGFLITMSWTNKKSVFDFCLARFLRIYPAAIVVILLSVFVLGLLITTLTPQEYVMHKTTHLYLQNTSLYRMYYYLPGVFNENPGGGSINGSLWTLPYEFTCYIFLGIIGLAQVLKTRFIALTVFVGLLVLDAFIRCEIEKIVIPILGIDFKTFYPLLLYFMAGVIYYQFRDKLHFSILGAIVTTFIIYFLKEYSWGVYLKILFIPYTVFAIAFSRIIHFKNFGKYGDFSYGMYLYAFPIQQLIVYFSFGKISLLVMILLSLLFTFPFAFLSWFFIEKPSIDLKKKFVQLF